MLTIMKIVTDKCLSNPEKDSNSYNDSCFEHWIDFNKGTNILVKNFTNTFTVTNHLQITLMGILATLMLIESRYNVITHSLEENGNCAFNKISK